LNILAEPTAIKSRGDDMPIYQTAHYQVKPEAVDKVRRAIEELVDYVRSDEPGTWFYASWQQQEDLTRFVHLFTFADKAAHERHGHSDAVRAFESVYRPELVGGPVLFTDYQLVATNGGTTR
jgi:quinol monooxygenase YgiN